MGALITAFSYLFVTFWLLGYCPHSAELPGFLPWIVGIIALIARIVK